MTSTHKPPATLYLVTDLEATCWKTGQPAPGETIEIGAVLVDSSNSVVAEFQSFVRPQLQPQLSEFCRELTTIQQHQVDEAPPFPEAFSAYCNWADSHGPAIFTTWGAYDRRQLVEDCLRHRMSGWSGFDPHLNLKRTFSALMDCTVAPGLDQALSIARLPPAGVSHRALDDARNTVRLLKMLVERFGHERVQSIGS